MKSRDEIESLPDVMLGCFSNRIQCMTKAIRVERAVHLKKWPAIAKDERTTITAKGAGLSYGDAFHSFAGISLSCERLNRVLLFDRETGQLIVEAGITIREIFVLITGAGWCLAVSPGISSVTIGGAVAADIHGKNHYRRGGFSQIVESFQLIDDSGKERTCSRSENADLFYATIGGMGLTGIIDRVTIRLVRHHSNTIETSATKGKLSLSETVDAVERLAERNEFVVAWIDMLKVEKTEHRNSVIFSSNYCTNTEKRSLAIDWKPGKTKPLQAISPFYNRFSNKLFNRAFYWKAPDSEDTYLQELRSFLFPWDSIPNWNRLYGKRGFVEYQFFVPKATGAALINDIVCRIARKCPIYFAALKRMRNGEGLLSYGGDGFSLLLDMPALNGLFSVLHECDYLLAKSGGRIHLAKDSRLSAKNFHNMYEKEVLKFSKIREKYDLSTFYSAMANRLDIK